MKNFVKMNQSDVHLIDTEGSHLKEKPDHTKILKECMQLPISSCVVTQTKKENNLNRTFSVFIPRFPYSPDPQNIHPTTQATGNSEL